MINKHFFSLLSFFFVLLLSQCKSSVSNDTATRNYARDEYPEMTTSKANLLEDVEYIKEDYYFFYDDSPIDNELTEQGLIKKYGKYRISMVDKYNHTGELSYHSTIRMDGDKEKSCDEKVYDSRGRIVLYVDCRYYEDEDIKRTKLSDKYSFIYEDEGTLTYRTDYIENENIGYPNDIKKSERYLFEEYDDNHRILKQLDKNGNLEVMWSETRNCEIKTMYHEGYAVSQSIYDIHGRLIEYWAKNQSNVLYLKNKITYDVDNKIKTNNDYDSDEITITYYLDEDFNQSSKIIQKDSNGNTKTEQTCLYNDRGDVTDVITIGESNAHKKYAYEYDDKGNWIIKTTTSDNNDIIVYVRHIKYYDGYNSDTKLADIINNYLFKPLLPTKHQNQSNNSLQHFIQLNNYNYPTSQYTPNTIPQQIITSNSGSSVVSEQRSCSRCHGTGRIEIFNYISTFGLDDPYVLCSECGQSFLFSMGHAHITCPSCHGHKIL